MQGICTEEAVFGVGQFKGVVEISPREILVAMVTN